jgi:hypothetical protein
LGDKIEKNEMGGACSVYGGEESLRWYDNIQMDLKEVGCGGMDWIELAQDTEWWRALVNGVMNPWVP